MGQGEDDGAPLVPGSAAETLIADEAALASLSADGGRAASGSGQWSWALFEGARDPNILFQIYVISPFFATVMMRDAVRGQALWGEIMFWSGIFTVPISPFMGAIADRGGPRKPWLALFALVMVVSFAGTWFGVPDSPPRIVFLVGLMVAINNVVFEFSNAFHGAMLSSIAPRRRIGGLSGLALALGNASGVLLLTFFVLAFIVPVHPLFGIDKAAHEPERLAGPISAVWMLVLAIPLFLFVPDRSGRGLPWRLVFGEGVATVLRTIGSLRHYRNIAHYLGARALFNDGMSAILTFTGIYAAGTFHFGAMEMAVFGIELSIFAALGGLIGGFLDDRLGSRRALFLSIGGTALFSALGLTMAPDRIFWLWHVGTQPALPLPIFDTWPRFLYLLLCNATAVCIVGGYASSRTMLVRLAPPEKMTEFFGMMSLSGTAASIFAPVSVALLTGWTHSQRGGMIAIVLFLTAGLLWLTRVRETRAVAV